MELTTDQKIEKNKATALRKIAEHLYASNVKQSEIAAALWRIAENTDKQRRSGGALGDSLNNIFGN